MGTACVVYSECYLSVTLHGMKEDNFLSLFLRPIKSWLNKWEDLMINDSPL